MHTTKKTKFSVIIPLFNKLEHIIRTIDSVLAQTFTSYEIIVVDDGSTDGSPEKVQQLRGDQVSLISQKNAGVSSARNRGVAEANGEIMAFIDADDTWEPHFLEEIFALKQTFPNAQAFATGYQFIVEGGRYVDPKIRFEHKVDKPYLMNDYFSVSAKGDLPFMMSSFCIKRDMFNSLGGFPEGVPMGEDQDVFARLAIESDIAYTPSVLSFYHLDSSNRACQRIVPEVECPFSEKVYLAAQKEIVSDAKRRDMFNYTAAHLLHIASLNIRIGRLDAAKRLLSDKRCRMQPVRYLWWLAKYSLKKINQTFSMSAHLG